MTNCCMCADKGCPEHPGRDECVLVATTTLFRVDMEDETGTPMCDPCADDALGSGLFTTSSPETSRERERLSRS